MPFRIDRKIVEFRRRDLAERFVWALKDTKYVQYRTTIANEPPWTVEVITESRPKKLKPL